MSCWHALTEFYNWFILQSLLECVEMLREQKADRDEVLDGLRDKVSKELTYSQYKWLNLKISERKMMRNPDLLTYLLTANHYLLFYV